MNEQYKPSYSVNDEILNLVAEISELVSKITILSGLEKNPKLRRENRIRTIQASLAIENNSLSLEQVTDVINGKRVLGLPREILEVKNAYEAYEDLTKLNPYSIKDLLKIHETLMYGLTEQFGIIRSGGVGIFKGKALIHMAPPAKIVPELLEKLFNWLKESKAHPLVKSCVFHYEFEFIHPFLDGNGRMGRMWQTLILYKWNPIFAWIPVETIIQKRQQKYYEVLEICDKEVNSTSLLMFLLEAILDTLREIPTAQVNTQVTAQVEKLLNVMDNREFTLRELMEKTNIKHRQTFRKNYILPAIEAGFIEMTVSDKPNSRLQKYRKKIKN